MLSKEVDSEGEGGLRTVFSFHRWVRTLEECDGEEFGRAKHGDD